MRTLGYWCTSWKWYWRHYTKNQWSRTDFLFLSSFIWWRRNSINKKTKKGCIKTIGETRETLSSWKFYPGTGETDDIASYNVINAPIAPLWREKDMSNCMSSLQTQTNAVRNLCNTCSTHKEKRTQAPSLQNWKKQTKRCTKCQICNVQWVYTE